MIFRLLICTLALSLCAQQAGIEQYSVAQGLAQSQVYAITQDTSGFIWFGTRGGGLSRFDGRTFYNYSTQNGLPSNFIRALSTDQKGTIWIGTDNGLSVFKNDQFQNFDATNGLFTPEVTAVLPLPNNEVLLGTNTGLFLIQKDTIIRFGRKADIPFIPIKCLHRDKFNRIWCGTEFGIYQFRYTTSVSEIVFFNRQNGLSNNSIEDFTEDSTGTLYVATYGGGITLFENNIPTRTLKQADGLPTNSVHSIFINRQQELWAGTGSGVARFRLSPGAKPYRIAIYTDQEGLSNNVVLDIFQDSYGVHWLGTSGGGVSKLGSERFIHFTAIPQVFGSWVFAIHEEVDSTLWFATSEGGITRYQKGVYKRFSQRDGFTAHNCKTIFRDSRGRLWMGTVGDGVYVYENNSFRHYSSNNGLPSRFITSVAENKDGTIWLGTAGAGLVEVQEKSGIRFKTYNERKGLLNNRINHLKADAQGNLWIATIEGLACMTQVNGIKKLLHYPTISGNVRSIVISDSNEIMAGIADKGIAVLKNNKVYWIRKELSSLNIYSILLNKNDLWIGTEKGLDRLYFDSTHKIVSTRFYRAEQGFRGIETIQNSILLDRQNRIWIGTIQGATCYQPNKDLSSDVKPTLSLTGIQLYFEKLKNTSIENPQAFSIPQNLTLKHNENHLSFQFTGIDMVFPASVQYRWKLEGLDTEWSPLTNKNEAVYSHLPAGSYELQLQAFSESGKASDIIRYTFTINPAFWNTWWFRLSGVILLLGMGYLIYQWRWSLKLDKIKEERKHFEMERNLLELEQKSLRLQMNPHFLFNCLNSIKGLIAENDLEGAKLYLTRFSKLMRNMLELSRKEFISLEEEINTLVLYVDLEKISSSKQYEFRIDVDASVSSADIQIPPLLLQPFVENAIWHGMHGHIPNGKIEIRIKRVLDQLHISIQDNGIGRIESNRMKREAESVHKSTALSIATERLYLLDKKLGTSSSSITIEDGQEHGVTKGTHILIILPIE